VPNTAVAVEKAKTSRGFTLAIAQPAGGVDRYDVTCVAAGEVLPPVSVTTIVDPVTVEMTPLTPYTTYQCVVATWFRSYNTTSTVSVTTMQDGGYMLTYILWFISILVFKKFSYRFFVEFQLTT